MVWVTSGAHCEEGRGVGRRVVVSGEGAARGLLVRWLFPQAAGCICTLALAPALPAAVVGGRVPPRTPSPFASRAADALSPLPQTKNSTP